MQLVNIGFGNIIVANKIVAIVSPESAPIKRMVQEAKDNKTAVDATYGRRTRAVLIMDSGHIILSAVQPETVAGRVDKDITPHTIRHSFAVHMLEEGVELKTVQELLGHTDVASTMMYTQMAHLDQNNKNDVNL